MTLPIGYAGKLNLSAIYANGNIVINPNGINYTSKFNNVSIDNQGVVNGLKVGSDIVTLSYSDRGATK